MNVALVTADVALLNAAIADRAALARALNCELADGWDVFREALGRARDAVGADPASARWGARFFVVDDPRTLVGWGGFKGAPREGVVELGYEIAPAWEGRGLATAAVGELLRQAWAEAEVQTVLAHTLAGPGASARVLAKCGFTHDGEVHDDDIGTVWRFRLDRTPAPSRYGSFSDTQLKREVDRLEEASGRASSTEVWETVQRDAALLRVELIKRLRERGLDAGDDPGEGPGDGPSEGPGEGPGGLREPRRPQPGGGAASILADPTDVG